MSRQCRTVAKLLSLEVAAADAEHAWIRWGDVQSARAFARASRKAEDARAALKATLWKDAAHVGGVLLLGRATELAATDQCPFCGERHRHGLGDGHRSAHCRAPLSSILAQDGTELRIKDGYILRSRRHVADAIAELHAVVAALGLVTELALVSALPDLLDSLGGPHALRKLSRVVVMGRRLRKTVSKDRVYWSVTKVENS